MIECKNCGHRVLDTDRWCISCGAPAPVAPVVEVPEYVAEWVGGTAQWTNPYTLHQPSPFPTFFWEASASDGNWHTCET